MSSPTTSASASTDRREATSVVLALGANLGPRLITLRRAVDGISRFVQIVRVSSLYETEPMDSIAGAPTFLNLALSGVTSFEPLELLERVLQLEHRLGRRRRLRNDPRLIDIDIVFWGTARIRDARLVLPHPRYAAREFVLAPLRELGLPWVDPRSGTAIGKLKGEGAVRLWGRLY